MILLYTVCMRNMNDFMKIGLYLPKNFGIKNINLKSTRKSLNLAASPFQETFFIYGCLDVNERLISMTPDGL